MKFELKIFLSIMFIFILSLSIINFVNLYIINQLISDYLDIQSRVYPDFFEKVKVESILEKKEKYATVIFLWEAFLVLGTSFVIYLVMDRYIKKEQRYKSFLQLIILSVSHKFGNSLSSILTNVEILKNKVNSKQLDRIEKVVLDLSKDVKILSDTFKKLEFEDRTYKNVDIKEVILESLKNFEIEEKKVILNIKPIKKYANKTDIDLIIYNILENAFKYSDRYIHIKTVKRYLVIRNDTKENVEGGTGVGLLIIESLCNLNQIRFCKKVRKKTFTIFLDFS